MKKLRLPKGKFCLVDDEDYNFLNKISWSISTCGYAQHTTSRGVIMMSRLILGKELKGNCDLEVDHKNGNRLDNRKENLRICTHQQNVCNSIKRNKTKTSSIYKGVSFNKKNKKWNAKVTFNKKIYQLGYFTSEIDAAKAYNEKAAELHGEFAKLNIIQD